MTWDQSYHTGYNIVAASNFNGLWQPRTIWIAKYWEDEEQGVYCCIGWIDTTQQQTQHSRDRLLLSLRTGGLSSLSSVAVFLHFVLSHSRVPWWEMHVKCHTSPLTLYCTISSSSFTWHNHERICSVPDRETVVGEQYLPLLINIFFHWPLLLLLLLRRDNSLTFQVIIYEHFEGNNCEFRVSDQRYGANVKFLLSAWDSFEHQSSDVRKNLVQFSGNLFMLSKIIKEKVMLSHALAITAHAITNAIIINRAAQSMLYCQERD